MFDVYDANWLRLLVLVCHLRRHLFSLKQPLPWKYEKDVYDPWQGNLTAVFTLLSLMRWVTGPIILIKTEELQWDNGSCVHLIFLLCIQVISCLISPSLELMKYWWEHLPYALLKLSILCIYISAILNFFLNPLTCIAIMQGLESYFLI